MKRTRLAFCLAAVFALAPSVAHAQNGAPNDQARAHFTHGVDLFKEGDFRAALIEFQRAYEASPNYKVLYNLGQTSLELQDYASALRAFSGYLEQGGKDVPAARRAQVEADLHKLESRVARVQVTVNVEGADVLVDDVPVAKSPLREPIIVSEGRRKITVAKAGLVPVSRVIDVAGGDRPTISLEVAEAKAPNNNEPAPPPAPPSAAPVQNTPIAEPPPPAPVHAGPSTGFWIGLSTTAALGVATGVLGGLALSAKSDFDAKVSQPGVTTQQVDDARNKTRNFALATDITGGVTVAMAITTVVLAFTTGGKKESSHAHAIVGPGTLGIAGWF
ncbi:MAG TPA: tetratricopeptide repeat protein [Polyangiaceae bacterium]|nr:tetratricopeptide repeat protein [Polyangiaceae bacterium]